MAIQNTRTALVCAGLAVCSVLIAESALAQGVSFEDARNFQAGVEPHSVAVGDFNGDGVPDLAVANQQSDNVLVFLGNGDGTFQDPKSLAVGAGGETDPRFQELLRRMNLE